MKTAELIALLREEDPSGEADVRIYICRRYGGYDQEPTRVRRFLDGGAVMITDERDDYL